MAIERTFSIIKPDAVASRQWIATTSTMFASLSVPVIVLIAAAVPAFDALPPLM